MKLSQVLAAVGGVSAVGASALWSALAPLPALHAAPVNASPLAAPVLMTAPVVSPAAAATTAPRVQTFVYQADKPLQSVSVAGSFNNWDKGANPLKVDADGRTWRGALPLGYGQYQYKFVLNGETWVLDSNALRNESDGNGNTNSVLLVLPPDYGAPAQPNDGQVASSALLHDPKAAPYFNYDQGALSFVLRARPGDVQSVALRLNGRAFPMTLLRANDLYAFYGATVPWDGKTDLAYSFELRDGAQLQSFGANGLSKAGGFSKVGGSSKTSGAGKTNGSGRATRLNQPQTLNQPLGLNQAATPFRLQAATFRPYRVPDWVEGTTFYQIFPDRFANGSRANDPAQLTPWDATPSGSSRMGGDAEGVRQHLDYLQELGVSGVYFNPVFRSPSNHRYDASDFKQLDPQFGTNAEFAALTRDLQQRGIRTVMDFVFNHTATDFAPFQSIRDQGAASPYKDWYYIKSYPVKVAEPPNYTAWFGYSAMPKLNLMNPPTGQYMLGLVDYWKSQVPLAGLRLDVANEVDPRFWRQLRTRVKGLDTQMWIVGEVWGDGTPWLGGDQWDSVMNYQFRDACLGFFAEDKTKATQFAQRLMDVYHSYPPQVSRNMMNLLSSHDTPRFLTLCHNDATLARLGATVQFTWAGAPSIYYGEEVGMQGGADPDNRRGMRWDLANAGNPMLRYYQRLIATRRGSRALQSGTPSMLLADDQAQTLAYARTLKDDIVLIVLNRSSQPQTVTVPLPRGAAMTQARTKGLTDALSNTHLTVKGETLQVTVPAMRAMVLVPAK